MKEYLLIVFSPFRIIETPSKLKIKTNTHVNLCISENIAITVVLIIGSLSYIVTAFVLLFPSVLSRDSLFLSLSLVKPFEDYLGATRDGLVYFLGVR